MYIVCFMSLNFRLILYRCHTCPFPCVVATISSMTVTKRPFLFRKSLPPAAGMRMGMSDRSQNLRCRAGLWVRDDIMFGGSCITFQPSRLFPFQPIGFSLFSHSAFHSLSLSLVNHTKSVDSAPSANVIPNFNVLPHQRHTMDNALKGSRQSTIGQDWGTG